MKYLCIIFNTSRQLLRLHPQTITEVPPLNPDGKLCPPGKNPTGAHGTKVKICVFCEFLQVEHI